MTFDELKAASVYQLAGILATLEPSVYGFHTSKAIALELGSRLVDQEETSKRMARELAVALRN